MQSGCAGMSAAPGPSRALGLLCILILALPVCWASTTVTEVTTLTEEANLQRLGGKSTEAQIQITSWTTGAHAGPDKDCYRLYVSTTVQWREAAVARQGATAAS